jgi:hypothetical protein
MERVVAAPRIRSVLCLGLLESYFDPGFNDSVRIGALLGQVLQVPGANIATSLDKPVGITLDPLDFAGSANSYLWANGGAGFPATTSFWIKFDALPTAPAQAVVLSRRDDEHPGPMVYVADEGGGVKRPWFITTSVDEATNVFTNSWATNLSTGQWYFVVVGYGIAKDADNNPIGSAPYLSVNGGSKVWGPTIGFVPHPGSHFRLGARINGDGPEDAATDYLDGKLNQLTFWNRELTSSEISLLYNSSNGINYPFVTE